MVRPLRAALALAVVVPVAIAAGCGSSSSSSAGAAAPTTAAPTTAPATTAPATTAPAAGGKTIAVAADPSGALAYVQKSLTAPAGSDTFDFTNDSPVPHNLTFEKAGSTDQIAGTPTISSSSASISVKLAKGTYTYFCTVPGHEAAGMKGTLTVN